MWLIIVSPAALLRMCVYRNLIVAVAVLVAAGSAAAQSDNFHSAPFITVPERTSYPSNGMVSFSTIGATSSHRNPGCGGSTPMDKWVKFQPTCDGKIYATTCQSFSSSFDTRIALWSSSGGTPGNVLECSDDNCSTSGTLSHISGNNLVRTGNVYYLQLGGYSTRTGRGYYDIYLKCDSNPTPPPCNSFRCVKSGNSCIRQSTCPRSTLADDILARAVGTSEFDDSDKDSPSVDGESDKGYTSTDDGDGDAATGTSGVALGLLTGACVLAVVGLAAVAISRRRRAIDPVTSGEPVHAVSA